MVTTASDGRATWTYVHAFVQAPVLSALAVDPDPGDARGIFVTIEQVTATRATVRVWQSTGVLLGGQTAVPVGSGVKVHVTASGQPT
ncbi:hypothetical protein [Streptomyces sp. NPDC006334]|uniref:hypothetical protein n=1 Tax=Streptomyces sp. NPDC006334 TaxID=3156754 RepID=UPI0033A271E6